MTQRVLEVGLEPTRPCGQRILSPLRLPIPPLELNNDFKEQKDPVLYVFIITQQHSYYMILSPFAATRRGRSSFT